MYNPKQNTGNGLGLHCTKRTIVPVVVILCGVCVCVCLVSIVSMLLYGCVYSMGNASFCT
eukprot:m.337002 g.337002  ORF g.337002 m.337002 type:complete len:60 (-) comp18017_c0_seq1:4065-4244(-)